jgi:hypothetical protein
MFCVFLADLFFDILAFFAHLFSFHDIYCIFLYSFKFLCVSEYWNIWRLEYSLEILCIKILFCLCADVQISILVSARVICSIVHAQVRDRIHREVCVKKRKSLSILINLVLT